MPRPGPLSDLRVLEFSHTVMGPCAGLLLADLGADVIKIEAAPEGDRTRKLTGFAGGFFATFNRNKRSVAIDLKQPEGQAILHQLIESTDVVLENYGPGTMERLGCGYDTLSGLNQRLVFLALKGFLAGPWEKRPALDEVVQFQSGLAYMTGPAGQPLRAGASVIDILGAVFGVTGVLAALRERDRTGKGQRVGSALFESAAFLMAPHITGGATTGMTIPPMTARKGAWGVYDAFATQDGRQLFVGVTSDAQWVRFCDAFDLHDLSANSSLSTNEQRCDARSWLIPRLAACFAQSRYEHVLEACQRAEVSCSPVGRPEELTGSEQLETNGGLLETLLDTARETVANSVPVPGTPLEFGTQRERPALHRQPPTLGQHTVDVLLESGWSMPELETLREQNTVVW